MQRPYWRSGARLPRFQSLRRNLKLDVAIVGGGVTGLTAAVLLRQAGKSVAVFERDRIGSGDTGHTTAHATMVTDRMLHELARRFGKDHARAVWEAGDAAIAQIRELACSLKIACDFHSVPAFLTAPLGGKASARDRKALVCEAETAVNLGFEARYFENVPGVHQPGVAFANQAMIHPLKYLAGLAQAIDQAGGLIFERSEATEIRDDPQSVCVNGQDVQCKHVIIATHVPLMGKTGLLKATLFQTKLAPYSTYAIAARLPKGTLPQASFFDTSDPYLYLRIERRARDDYAILGGADHKTGQRRKTEACFATLARTLRKLAPKAKIDSQWSGQVIETHDGLPFIGASARRQYIATGFSGNGITFGTLAGMMLRDAVTGKRNPWQDLFDPQRKNIRSGAWNYLKENLDYPYYLAKDWVSRTEGKSVRSVPRGDGRILRLHGDRTAVYRDKAGRVTRLSPVCTHMGCLVNWNQAEQTWDCPCHGSRFHATGAVLAGPAEQPLPKR